MQINRQLYYKPIIDFIESNNKKGKIINKIELKEFIVNNYGVKDPNRAIALLIKNDMLLVDKYLNVHVVKEK